MIYIRGFGNVSLLIFYIFLNAQTHTKYSEQLFEEIRLLNHD